MCDLCSSSTVGCNTGSSHSSNVPVAGSSYTTHKREARRREQRLHMPYYIPTVMSFCVSVWVWGYLNRVVGGSRGVEGQTRGHATHRASCRYHMHTETGDVHTQVKGAEVIGQEMRSQDARCASGQDLGRDFRRRPILPTLCTHLPGTTGHRSSRRSP
jgi:hypothetical protein